MGIDILERVRELIREDDSLTNANDCRNATTKLAAQLKNQFPDKKVEILAFPEAGEGNGVHYALSADSDSGDELLINPVQAPGFPQYLGSRSNAIPTFSLLKRTDKVK